MKPVSEERIKAAANEIVERANEMPMRSLISAAVRWRESLPDESTGWRKYDLNDTATWPEENETIVALYGASSERIQFNHAGNPFRFKHWLRIPPPPQNDDDKAFEQALKDLGYDHPMSDSKLSELKAIWQHARKKP